MAISRDDPDPEAMARELVANAVQRGGDLWEHVSPETLDIMVRAVASDLRDAAELEAELKRRTAESTTPESRRLRIVRNE